MNQNGNRVARNATYLFISQIITWAMATVSVIIIPRYLGPAGSGQLHLANSLWNITSLLIIFGMDTVMVKEIARDYKRAGEFAGTSMIVRTVFFVIGYSILVSYVNLDVYSPTVKQIVYIFGAANIAYQIGFSLRAALNGMELMGRTAVVDIIGRFVGLVLVITMVVLTESAVAIAIVTVFGAWLNTAMVFYVAVFRHGVRLSINPKLFLWLPRQGIPYMLSFLARNIYVQIDVVIISWFVSERVLGWYSAADVAFGTMLFLPNIVGTAIFPALSRLFDQDRQAFNRLFQRAFNLIMVASTAIGFGVIIIGQQAIDLLLGAEFTQAGPVLMVFGVVIIFTSQNVLLGSTLNAMNRQTRLTILTIVAVALTIPIDLLIIPWFQENYGNGAIGGAVAYIITEGAITLGAVLSIPRETLSGRLWFKTVLAIFAGLVMILATWWSRSLFLGIPIVLGATVYIAMVVILRLIPVEDWADGWQLAKQMWGRARRRIPGLR